jgi:hypothetical protein
MKFNQITYASAIANLRKTLARDAEHSQKTSISLLLALNVISFVLLCLITFHYQVPTVMYRYDGTFLLSTAKNQRLWMGDGLSFTMNFLEGNGGLWWAQINTLFDPPFIISRLIHDDTYAPVVAFTVYASEFFISTIVLGFCL